MKIRLLGAPALLLACTGCTHNPQIQPDQAPPMAAKVLQVSPTSTRSMISLEGVVVARQVAEISSQVLAPVAAIRVHEGDTVKAGEVLVRLSSAPLQAGVAQSQSQLQAAKQQEVAAGSQKDLAAQTYARYEILNQRHSVTPHEFDQVKAQLDAASAQQQAAAAQAAAAGAAVQAAEATNSYTTIRAPFAGVVTKKMSDVGAVAAPGIPLLQIEDATEHEVDLEANETSLANFHLSAPVEVLVNGSDAPIAGKVKQIVPGGDPAAHTFTVKIGLPASRRIYSGMTANVLIPGGEQTGITIPRSAVRRRGQMDSVLALDGSSVAQIRYVALGQDRGATVEVISGLNAGDRILAQPADAFIGHRIETQP